MGTVGSGSVRTPAVVIDVVEGLSTTTTINENDHNNNDIDNDITADAARRATITPLANGQHLPAVDFAACHTDAGVTPSGASVPFQGASSLGAGEQRTAGKCQPLAQVYSACTQPRSQVYGWQHMPRPPAVVGACKPFGSLPLLSTTQGTGTQGKTRGLDPGHEPLAVRPMPEVLECPLPS